MGGESRRCFHATHPPRVKWNLLLTCYQHPCAERWKKFFFFSPEINPDWWQHFLEHLQRCQTRFRRASRLLTLVLQQELLTLVLKKFSQIFKGFKVYPQILVWWNMWNHLVRIKLSPQQTADSSSSFPWGSCLNTAAQGPCLSLCPLRLLAGIRPALCLLMYWVWQNQSTMNPFTFCQVGSNHTGLEYENEGRGTFHITAENPAASPLYQLRGFLQLWILVSGREHLNLPHGALFLLHTLSAEFHQFREPPCSLRHTTRSSSEIELWLSSRTYLKTRVWAEPKDALVLSLSAASASFAQIWAAKCHSCWLWAHPGKAWFENPVSFQGENSVCN